jgi:cyclohexyl-isocyanide hydratase
MIIGIPVYDGVDLLDVTGPYEMFNWMPSAGQSVEVLVLAETDGKKTSRDGFTFLPHKSFRDAPQLDVLWVPGGDPAALACIMGGPSRVYLEFLIKQSQGAQIVASVCEGALLLAASGLLDGYRATTHWNFIPCLRQFPKVHVADGNPRFVIDRNRITGGGISSGLDEALALIKLLAGSKVAESVQQGTQYYPDPPVKSVIPSAASCPFSW